MIGNFFNIEDGVPETQRIKTGVDALDERLDSGLRPGQVAEIRTSPSLRSCEILFLLDSSGSMDEFASEAVEQFNVFLAEQRRHAQPDALMSLSLFNEDLQVITEGQSIVGFRRLSLDDYDPDGNTALVDAMGKTIASGMTRHALTERPVRTLVVLLTDGGKTPVASTRSPRCGAWSSALGGTLGGSSS